MFNYYESEYFRIKLYNNKLNDLFQIDIENNKIIIIQRIDQNTGWGQDLNVSLFNKCTSEEEIISIGNSEENIKKIFLKDSILHHISYVNDKFKLYYISYEYNDTFTVDYNEEMNIISIKRTDSETGWGQNLNVKYVELNNPNRTKIINIGKSDEKSKMMKINIDMIPYESINNYYETDNYIVTIYQNKYNDQFLLHFYQENNTIYIKRIDKNIGWGQNLMLNIFNIYTNDSFIIYIGSSSLNEIYKRIDLKMRKCYVSLTTIPSRIKLDIFQKNIDHFIKNQTYPIEKLFIVIAKKYKRFSEKISDEKINALKSNPMIEMIVLEEDLGPASKYLAPLTYCPDILKDNLLIIIDDDREYNKNLVRNFVIGHNSFPNITFSSGLWKEYFNKEYKNRDESFLELNLFKEDNNNKFYFGQGLGGFFGFCIHCENYIHIQKFIEYNYIILKKLPKSFYHDEGIILGFLKYYKETILYLKHKGCNIIEEELADALCKSNLVDRGLIEKEIVKLTNLEKI